MSVFTYHLVRTSYSQVVNSILFSVDKSEIPGLIHMKTMNCMRLGSAIFSVNRILIREISVFAQWEDETSIDKFLAENKFGKILSEGWHVRMSFMRQWGEISEYEIPKTNRKMDEDETVVVVTLAKMKYFEIPRFIHWGRPVEKQVRDHSGKILSLASARFPRTVSTFSIWENKKELMDMVHGNQSDPDSKRHFNAMKERERRNFHKEFTTLRFRPIAEYGSWEGKTQLIPKFRK